MLVKQKRASQAYEMLRKKALEKAEADRLQDKSAPDYLQGIDPPWNDGRKEVEDLYDEMMVDDFEQRIAAILEKAEKAKGGPGGQGRR